MFTDEHLISNSGGSVLTVSVEPWGDVVRIPAGKIAKFVSNSEFSGQYTREDRDNEVFLYAWSGCNLHVTIDGSQVLHYDLRTPANTELLNKILHNLGD